MPWDETELWLADISESGDISNSRKVAGGDNVSVYHPFWSADNQLFYVADPKGWWHIYSLDNPEKPVHEQLEIEFGLPQWVFGCRTVQWFDEKSLVAIGTRKGQQALYQISLKRVQLSYLAITGQHLMGRWSLAAMRCFLWRLIHSLAKQFTS